MSCTLSVATSPVHFVTGGTGFVGSNLILELLRQSNVQVYALVRASAENPTERLHRALIRAASLYGYPEDIEDEIRVRCHALSGDLLHENCGVSMPENLCIDQFWHGAASLCYENRYREEIFATNVTGTRHATSLARLLNCRTFNYISTAYVSGKRSGFIAEAPVTCRDANNLYEVSKIEAEDIVMNATEFRTRILRPSIVVGHSKTQAAMNFSGMYGFMRRLSRFKAMMTRIQEGYVQREALRMEVEPLAQLNLVPVNHVAQQAVQIGLSDSPARFFHLTNAAPPNVGDVLRTMFRQMGLKEPVFVDSTDEFTWIDSKFGAAMDYYTSYLVGNRVFDRTNTDAVIRESSQGEHPYDPNGLMQLYGWYLNYLEAENRTQHDKSRQRLAA